MAEFIEKAIAQEKMSPESTTLKVADQAEIIPEVTVGKPMILLEIVHEVIAPGKVALRMID